MIYTARLNGPICGVHSPYPSVDLAQYFVPTRKAVYVR